MRVELFPFIESNYRIDVQARMLSGYSFGGLFGLFALFHEPDLFNTDLKADVIITAGAMEELLLSRNYENLDVKTVVFDNENHLSCYPAALSRGLIELLGNKKDN